MRTLDMPRLLLFLVLATVPGGCAEEGAPSADAAGTKDSKAVTQPAGSEAYHILARARGAGAVTFGPDTFTDPSIAPAESAGIVSDATSFTADSVQVAVTVFKTPGHAQRALERMRRACAGLDCGSTVVCKHILIDAIDISNGPHVERVLDRVRATVPECQRTSE
jgi:hypothetical protein